MERIKIKAHIQGFESEKHSLKSLPYGKVGKKFCLFVPPYVEPEVDMVFFAQPEPDSGAIGKVHLLIEERSKIG